MRKLEVIPVPDKRLEELIAEIRACRKCIESPLGKPLPHEPRPIVSASRNARVCIAGQAPGKKVHASGKPFDDPSGVRLRSWLGVTEGEFYNSINFIIVPMSFCFPGYDVNGNDMPPRRECTNIWHEKLYACLPQIELFVLIGGYAHSWHLKKDVKRGVGETVRAWKRFARPELGGTPAIPLPHPSWRNNAWLKENPWFQTDVLPYLKREIRLLIT